MEEKSKTPNRDEWFKRNAKRGMEVDRSKDPRRKVVESTSDTVNAGTTELDAANTATKYGNEAPRTPAPTPTPPRSTNQS